VLFASLTDTTNDLKRFLKNPAAFNTKDLNECTLNALHGKAASKNIEEWLGPKRINHFKIVLKAVRFWAHRRGIYSTNMGYLSGITLAVMVGRVC
jgi:poly(A) polymerase Pap1